MRTYIRRRRKRNILKKWIIPGILLVAVIVTACVLIFRPRPYQQLGSELIKLDIPGDSQICPFASGAVYINSEAQSLHFIDQEGNEQWGFTNAVAEMGMTSSANRLAIYISTKLQMLDSSGNMLFSANYQYPIQKMAVGDSVIAMLQYTGDSARQVLVIDSEGQTLDTLTEPSGQNIINFGIFGDNGSGVWIITVDHSSISPTYRFSTYRYEEQKRITVSYADDGQVLYKPIFYSSSIALIGSSEIVGIDYTGAVLYRTRTNGYEISQENTGTDMLLLRTQPDGLRADSSAEMMCVSNDGESLKLLSDESILGAYSTEKYYYIFTQNNMLRYDKGNMNKVEFTMPEKITEIIPSDGYILLKGESYYRLEIE